MHSTYIKFKRVHETMGQTQLQDYLDRLVVDGFDVLYYNENILNNNNLIEFTMLLGKKR